jgi:Type IV secretion system pilin
MTRQTKHNLALSLLSIITMSFVATIPTHAQSLSDFKLFQFDSIESLLTGITSFLVGLAGPLAGLVIVYGGYQYFLGGFDQKADGKKAIQAGVIGLVIVLSYQIIISLVTGTISGGTFNTAPLIAFIGTINGALILLSSAIAVAVIIYGGYKYMFSSVPGAKGDGKEAITNGILGLVAIAIASPLVTLIQGTISGTTSLNINTGTITSFVINIINNFLIPLSSVITVFFFIVGGYYILTSNGDSSKYKKGLDVLKNALIGLIVILVSFTLTQIIIYAVQGLKLGS